MTLALLLAGSVLAQTSAIAGPAVATRWKLTGESRNDCLGHAMESIKRAGFDVQSPGSESMIGRKPEYTASIRCVTEQRMVFFVVSGPSNSEANRLLEAIYRMF